MGVKGPKTQAAAIKCLRIIAENHGYKHQTRKQDPSPLPVEKKFLPDLIATRYKGKKKRVFEVEANVTNNTVYKSLFSLLNALKAGATIAYLVVPKHRVDFASNCLTNVRNVIRHYSKPGKGRPPKINIEILSFSEVGVDCAKAKKYEENGRIGSPPKCPFLPR